MRLVMDIAPCFKSFPPYTGERPSEFNVGYLGLRSRREWNIPNQYDPKPGFPPFDQEYFEWVDLLESILLAGPKFTMLDLGAGYGRWCLSGALGALRLGKEYHLVAVEPEPTHYAWLQECISLNQLDSNHITLIRAAVGKRDGESKFFSGNPQKWYGQEVYRLRKKILNPALRSPDVKVIRVPEISLATALSDVDFADLVDFDIQGAELKVIRQGLNEVARKVRRMHVSTHSREIHSALRNLFLGASWKMVFDFDLGVNDTNVGRIDFVDGVQSWINPNV